MSTTDLKAIIKSGASLVISCEKISNSDLKNLVTIAKEEGVSITLKNLRGRSLSDLKSIAKSGKGFVTFDFCE